MSDDFREVGYESAKGRMAASGAKWMIVVFGGIGAYVVVKFIGALNKEDLRTLALTFFAIVMALLALAGALALVTLFRYVQKPGVQLSGKLGEYERRFGLD